MGRKEITTWTPDEEYRLAVLYSYHASDHNKWESISEEMGKPVEACRSHWRVHGYRIRNRLQESPYPKYDQPLEMHTDKCVIIPDPEFPFHNAEFMNRVLDLCQVWKVDNAIIAGDMIHFDSLSTWNPSWMKPNGKGGLDEKQERLLVEFLKTLGKRQQEKGFELLESIGPAGEDGSANVSNELRIARKSVKVLMQCFKNVDVVIGNHEGRLLRQLETPLFPDEITRLVEAQTWRIAPFYYSILWSNNVKWMIEHPKSAALYTAEKLSAKYQCNVICAHSHILRFTWDMSGYFYAIMTGCCADEQRLPYAAQRHTNTPSHGLGATIVRDGYPYLLHKNIDWERMAKMA